MVRTLLFATAALASAAQASVVLPQDERAALKSVADRVHGSVIAVRAQATVALSQGKDPSIAQTPSFGTGVLIGDGLAVTTLHSVGNLLPGKVVSWRDIEVLAGDSSPVAATLIGWFPELDLAVLRLTGGGNGATVELSPDVPAIGEPLLAMGTDDEQVLVIGVNVAGVQGDQLLLRTARRMDSRYWGGPLFDAHGRLAGISLPSALPRALSSPALAGLLESFNRKPLDLRSLH